MQIQGFTAIVTGSTGRLGQAIALGLAAQGMDCICHYYQQEEAARSVAAQITAMGRRAATVQADLECEADMERFFEQAAAFGKARVLVNSASVFERCPLDELTGEEVQRTLGINLAAPVLASRSFVQVLEAEGLNYQTAEEPFAKIVNLADVAAMKPWAEYAAYCASKAGLIGLTKAAAQRTGTGDIGQCHCPGIVTAGTDTPDEENKQLARIPAGRFGQPDEIVRSILFLLENDYITGQTLCVDGGRSI